MKQDMYFNTPKLCGSEMKKSIDELKNAIISLRDSDIKVDEEEVEEALAMFSDCLNMAMKRDYKAIESTFPEFYGNGAFKETYELTSNLVIKFCSQFNNTREEEKLLRAAKEANVYEIFLPTEFVSFGDTPAFMPNIYEMEVEDVFFYDIYARTKVEDDEHEDSMAVYCEIQPKANLAGDEDALPRKAFYESEYNGDNVVYYMTGEVVPYEKYKKIHVNDLDWVQSIITAYGDVFFERFIEFAERNNIVDLHNENIGYVDDVKSGEHRPVILDCLSQTDDSFLDRR